MAEQGHEVYRDYLLTPHFSPAGHWWIGILPPEPWAQEMVGPGRKTMEAAYRAARVIVDSKHEQND